MNISKYVTYKEVTQSNIATTLNIHNFPNDDQLKNLRLVCMKVFDPVREHFRKPIAITSGFRSQELNTRIGGSKTSQHMTGQALDIDGDRLGGVSNGEIFNYIKDNLEFDQLIWEFGNDESPDWVHVSYSDIKNKKQILKATKRNGKTIYAKY